MTEEEEHHHLQRKRKRASIMRKVVTYTSCMVMVVTIVAVAAVTVEKLPKLSYKGVMVLRVEELSQKQAERLDELKTQLGIRGYYMRYLKAFDLRFRVEYLEDMERFLKQHDYKYRVLIEDIQELIDDQEEGMAKRRKTHKSEAFDFGTYHSYKEIVSYLQELPKKNKLVRTETVGFSREGREIILAKISAKTSTSKPVILLDCLMHANEWSSTAVCMWILNELSTKYETDVQVRRLVDKYDWYIKPISNPDGYFFSWKRDRLWRRNRMLNENMDCSGVDLNRNFDAGYQATGTEAAFSKNPCGTLLRGPFPFSEPETQATRDVLLQYRERIQMVLFMKSYGQLWLSPFVGNESLPRHYGEMEKVMRTATEAIRSIRGSQYHYGPAARTLHRASHTAMDYAYEKLGIIHSYTIQLPDQGSYGDIMPVQKIGPTAVETWDGIKAAVFSIK